MRGNAGNIRTLLERADPERRIGPFALVEQLGRGGFAPVWLAKETYGVTELRTAAVKLFALEESAGDAAKRQRIVEEARALCQVEHPNVVRFYSLPIDEGAEVMGLAMEHIAGTPLDVRLAREGKLGVAVALDVAVAIASALSAVHRAGLVHRDVKPSNVIDAGGVYKLIDFGIAAADAPAPEGLSNARIELADVSSELRGASPSSLGSVSPTTGALRAAPTIPIGGIWGTVGYVDPACVATRASASPGSDLYALGALLFECITGKVPAAAGATVAATLSGAVLDGRKRPPLLTEIDPELPAELARIVASLLEPDRRQRPTSAEWVATQLEHVRTRLEGVRRALPPEDVGPFRGLGRFEESDRSVYFGRTSEIGATVQMLRARGLVALIGPSGCGKSSLARAGVLPFLADGGLGGWPRRWDTAVAEPGSDPRASITAALARFVDRDRSSTPEALLAALADRAQTSDFGVALLLDQLEELALVTDGPSRRFAVDFLLRVSEQPLPGVRVIVTLRRDMLEHVLALGPLGRAIVRGSVLLEPLSEIAWGDVLDQALGSYGYRFEDETVRADVLTQLHATSDAMPLVQFALTELWRQRDTRNKRFTRAGLEQLGGIAGALERHAEATLAELARDRPEGTEAARRLLLSLTTVLGTRATRTPEDLLRAAGEPASVILAGLEASRLVARTPRGVTLAHEALLTQWGRLRRWLAEAREDRVLADELERDAERWRGDDEAVPLWRRRRLAYGEELARRGSVALSADAAAFLVAGRRAERRTRVVASVAAAIAVAIAATSVGLYFRASRAALKREQADRAAAEEQTRQVQSKQGEIDRLLRELDDSRTKERIVALQREIRGEPSVEASAPVVDVVRARPAAPHAPVAASSSSAGPPAEAPSSPPVVKVREEW